MFFFPILPAEVNLFIHRHRKRLEFKQNQARLEVRLEFPILSDTVTHRQKTIMSLYETLYHEWRVFATSHEWRVFTTFGDWMVVPNLNTNRHWIRVFNDQHMRRFESQGFVIVQQLTTTWNGPFKFDHKYLDIPSFPENKPKMQTISNLQWSKVALKTPQAEIDGVYKDFPFGTYNSGVEMRFSSLTYPFRKPIFELDGEVVSLMTMDPTYGQGYNLLFKPAAKDLANLEMLENILNEDFEGYEKYATQIGFKGGYDFRPTMTENYQLRIKITTGDDGWNFVTDLGDDLPTKLTNGKKITIGIQPGFYFNDKDKKFGLFNKLKSLRETEITPPKKGGRK